MSSRCTDLKHFFDRSDIINHFYANVITFRSINSTQTSKHVSKANGKECEKKKKCSPYSKIRTQNEQFGLLSKPTDLFGENWLCDYLAYRRIKKMRTFSSLSLLKNVLVLATFPLLVCLKRLFDILCCKKFYIFHYSKYMFISVWLCFVLVLRKKKIGEYAFERMKNEHSTGAMPAQNMKSDTKESHFPKIWTAKCVKKKDEKCK